MTLRGSLLCAALLSASRGIGAETIVFTEIHYNPGDSSDLEFVELHNRSAAPVDLLGWSFSDGIRYAFTRSSVIQPGGFLLVARNPEAASEAFGLEPAAIAGPFEGALDDSGERLALVDGEGRLAGAVTYDDGFPFDPAADGAGLSLERVCFDAPAEAPFNWRAGEPSPGRYTGAQVCPPGAPPANPQAFPVIFNEIFYHPQGRPGPPHEFIELFNRGPDERDISGWSLDRGVQFTFPQGTRLQAGGFIVVAQDPAALRSRYGLEAAGVYGPFEEASILSNSGEALRLVNAAREPQDEVAYGEDGPWPALADGLGGSLQRVDPLGPSSAAGNWRAGPIPPDMEPEGGDWMTFRTEGFHEGTRFYIYLLGMGEVLVDDIRMEVKNGDGTSHLQGGDFGAGSEAWSATGNHGLTVLSDGGYGDNGPCGRLQASAPGNGFQNGVRQTMATRPAPTELCVLTLRVKPLSGESMFIARSANASGDDGALYIKADSRTGQAEGTVITPLKPNSVGGGMAPATIELLGHEPPWPTSQDPVAVMARVIALEPVTVAAIHQIGDGPTAETPLLDDGAGADLTAADGTFSGFLPPSPDGSLAWYSVRARGLSGAVAISPPLKNPAPVTGYLVEDSLPDQNEDVRLFFIFSPGALGDLSCSDGTRVEGDFVDFRGRAYRDVGLKFRGETACGYPKKPMRVEFNRGDRFDGQGDLNFNAGWNDKSMLREQFGFDFFRDAGCGYSETHMARVHTNRGAFHGAYFTIEDPAEDYLKRNRRTTTDGFYKCRTAMLTGSTAGYEPRTDVSQAKLPEVGQFATRMNSLSGQALIDFLDENMDIEAMFDYQAVQDIIIDGDSVVKNWLLYHGRHELEGPGPARFTCFPWDIDLSHGQMLLTTDVRNYDIHPLFQTQTYPFHDQGYHGMLNALLQRAPNDYYVKAFYGRIWQLLEEKFNTSVLFPKLDAYEAATGDTVLADLRKWPRTWGARGTDPVYWRNDFRTFVQRRHDFLVGYLQGNNPTTQGRRFQYVPAPRLKFTEIHYNPPGSGGNLEFVELTSLEDVPVLLDGWDMPLLGYVFPPGAQIGPKGTLIVARNPAVLRQAPGLDGVTVLGPYALGLPGGGGVLRLRDDGLDGKYYPETIDVVVYEDDAPWPGAADGGGKSLELAALSLDNDYAASWRAGWSPGRAAAENLPPIARIEASPDSGEAPLQVFLSAAGSSDPDGDELSYSWSIPGKASDDRAVLLAAFDTEGTVRVSVTVRDSFGGEAVAEVDINVGPRAEPRFRRGDSNGDGSADLSDAVFTLAFLFTGGAGPGCPDAADSDDDGLLGITDAIFFLGHLFLGMALPPPPGPADCGLDPTEDALAACAGQADCG